MNRNVNRLISATTYNYHQNRLTKYTMKIISAQRMRVEYLVCSQINLLTLSHFLTTPGTIKGYSMTLELLDNIETKHKKQIILIPLYRRQPVSTRKINHVSKYSRGLELISMRKIKSLFPSTHVVLN